MNINECYFNISKIDDNTNFWMVRTKRGFFFDEFVTQGFIAIGWNSITESMVSTSLSKSQTDRLKEYIKEDYGENKPGTSLNKCIRFCHELKCGDIAVIVDNGRIAFAYIGDYYEDTSPDLTVEKEKEINQQIEKANIHADTFKCPYIKRRHIEVIKVMGEEDTISPYLHRAIAGNWHSLSDLNEYAENILSACFDTFAYKNNLTLTFRVKQKNNINVVDLATFVLNAAKMLSDDEPEKVSVKTTLHSPGDIILQICDFVQENALPLLMCYVMTFGGKAGDYEFHSIIGVVKNIINAKYDKQKKDLELRKLSAEVDLTEQQATALRLENMEKQRQLYLNSIETYGEELSKASGNLEIMPSAATIDDISKIIDEQIKDL